LFAILVPEGVPNAPTHFHVGWRPNALPAVVPKMMSLEYLQPLWMYRCCFTGSPKLDSVAVRCVEVQEGGKVGSCRGSGRREPVIDGRPLAKLDH
jgi:hypothetical protein